MKKIVLLFACFLVYSCQNIVSEERSSSVGEYQISSDELSYEDEIEVEPPRTAEPQPPVDIALTKGSKVIKIGNMDFEVSKLEVAKRKIDALLDSVNGYYENELYRSFGNRISYVLKARIPTERFDELINVLESGVGELKSKSISRKDVTGEFVDVNVRLENNLAYLKQFQSILLKAKSIKEILEVQEKIRRIEEEIESKKGRLKYLNENVKYSTLNMEISELISRKKSSSQSFGHRIVKSFENGIQGFLNFIIGIVNFWPFLLLIVFLYFGRRPVLNSFKKGWKNIRTPKDK